MTRYRNEPMKVRKFRLIDPSLTNEEIAALLNCSVRNIMCFQDKTGRWVGCRINQHTISIDRTKDLICELAANFSHELTSVVTEPELVAETV